MFYNVCILQPGDTGRTMGRGCARECVSIYITRVLQRTRYLVPRALFCDTNIDSIFLGAIIVGSPVHLVGARPLLKEQ